MISVCVWHFHELIVAQRTSNFRTSGATQTTLNLLRLSTSWDAKLYVGSFPVTKSYDFPHKRKKEALLPSGTPHRWWGPLIPRFHIYTGTNIHLYPCLFSTGTHRKINWRGLKRWWRLSGMHSLWSLWNSSFFFMLLQTLYDTVRKLWVSRYA